MQTARRYDPTKDAQFHVRINRDREGAGTPFDPGLTVCWVSAMLPQSQ